MTSRLGIPVLYAGLLCALAGGQQPSGAPATATVTGGAEEKTFYRSDFEDGKGLGSHNGAWSSATQGAKVTIDAPVGQGNDSKLALTVRGRKSMEMLCCDMPLWGKIVEPKGWDGRLHLKFYNGGFDSVRVLYNTVVPGDVSYAVRLNAPRGQWVALDLPFDDFLHFGRRPRRGCALERIIVIAEKPDSDEGAVFQMDDIRLCQVRQANPPVEKPKPPLSPGTYYLQNFDDPEDWDIQGYYPHQTYCSVDWTPGGLDAEGKLVEKPVGNDRGCLKIECHSRGRDFRGGGYAGFPGEGTVIEFDLLVKGAGDIGVIARTAKTSLRQYLQPSPPTGVWTHVKVSAEDFVPYGVNFKDGMGKKLGKGETYERVLFTATADASDEHYLLIDNLVVHKAGPSGPGPAMLGTTPGP